MTTLAQRFLSAREALGVGHNELDRLAGRSTGSVSRIESGQRKHLSPETVAAYADALGVAYDWLATGDGPMRAVSLADYKIADGPDLPALRRVLLALAPSLTPGIVGAVWASAAGKPDRSEIEWADVVVRQWIDERRPAPELPAPRPKLEDGAAVAARVDAAAEPENRTGVKLAKDGPIETDGEKIDRIMVRADEKIGDGTELPKDPPKRGRRK